MCESVCTIFSVHCRGGPTSAGMARHLPEPFFFYLSYSSPGTRSHFPISYALMFVGANIDSSSVVFSFSLKAAFSRRGQGHGHSAFLTQESKSHFNSSAYSANETSLTDTFAA